MPRDPRPDVLFEPIEIGCKTLPNRFYQVPHCSGFGVVKPWTQARHRSSKAEGGWGAVCTEYCSISPVADESPSVAARMWDEPDSEHLRLMTDEARRPRALAAIELLHSGVHAHDAESRLPPAGPSQTAGGFSNIVPRTLSIADIRRIQSDWVLAAERSRDAGVASRLLADAIFDGHRLGREVDGPHPQTALPYLREGPASLA